jgi:hypothetical protein
VFELKPRWPGVACSRQVAALASLQRIISESVRAFCAS